MIVKRNTSLVNSNDPFQPFRINYLDYWSNVILSSDRVGLGYFGFAGRIDYTTWSQARLRLHLFTRRHATCTLASKRPQKRRASLGSYTPFIYPNPHYLRTSQWAQCAATSVSSNDRANSRGARFSVHVITWLRLELASK